jgi:hypothetical protein
MRRSVLRKCDVISFISFIVYNCVIPFTVVPFTLNLLAISKLTHRYRKEQRLNRGNETNNEWEMWCRGLDNGEIGWIIPEQEETTEETGGRRSEMRKTKEIKLDRGET